MGLLGRFKSSPCAVIRKGIPRSPERMRCPDRPGTSSGTPPNGTPGTPGRRPSAAVAARPPRAQCPNRLVGANIPLSSKYLSASSTDRKILVAVSVMKGLGFFLGFHTT